MRSRFLYFTTVPTGSRWAQPQLPAVLSSQPVDPSSQPPPSRWTLAGADIFWVFATPVMVSVAKNFDAPIKLLFPRALEALGAPRGGRWLGGDS